MTAPVLTRFFSSGLTRRLLTPHAPEHYARSLGMDLDDDPTAATVTGVDRSVPGYTLLTLRLPEGARRPAPGGALGVGVVVDGVVHRRHYSPVDPTTAPVVRGVMPTGHVATIAVRVHPGGVVSERLRRSAHPGMRLLLDEPVEDAALPEDRPSDVLLVSGGSGLTPMLAIASTLAAEGHCAEGRGRVAWIHYVRSVGEVPFADRVAALRDAGIDVHIVETADAATGTALRGHLTAEHLAVVAPWHPSAEVFLCGPDALADGVRELLGDERFADVRRERFAATTGPVPDGDGGTVTHVRSGVTAHNAGTTLLEGAEAAGLSPQHGCRMGICHTCTAVRVSGATRDLRTGEVSAEPGCRVQICVNAPVGDVEIDL